MDPHGQIRDLIKIPFLAFGNVTVIRPVFGVTSLSVSLSKKPSALQKSGVPIPSSEGTSFHGGDKWFES